MVRFLLALRCGFRGGGSGLGCSGMVSDGWVGVLRDAARYALTPSMADWAFDRVECLDRRKAGWVCVSILA